MGLGGGGGESLIKDLKREANSLSRANSGRRPLLLLRILGDAPEFWPRSALPPREGGGRGQRSPCMRGSPAPCPSLCNVDRENVSYQGGVEMEIQERSAGIAPSSNAQPSSFHEIRRATIRTPASRAARK
jgi:hypothetical protein